MNNLLMNKVKTDLDALDKLVDVNSKMQKNLRADYVKLLLLPDSPEAIEKLKKLDLAVEAFKRVS